MGGSVFWLATQDSPDLFACFDDRFVSLCKIATRLGQIKRCEQSGQVQTLPE